jgi:long-subunit fatty acid transport protein
MKIKTLILAGLALPVAAFGQFIEDGLRIADVNSAITARAAGLGVSYIGINDDAAALRINPAGLSLIPTSEFNVGFAFRNLQAQTEFNNQTFDQTPTNTFYLSNIVITAPFGQDNENTVAFGYFNEAVNDSRIEYNTFNEREDASFFFSNPLYGFDLSVGPDPGSRNITDSVQQDNFTLIDGNKHSLYFGGSFELLESINLGFNIAPKWGSINIDRIYDEFDRDNIYDTYIEGTDLIDYNRLEMNQFVTQDYIGITGAVGFQVNYSDYLRFGGSIELPSYYNVEENFGGDYKVFFDNGDVTELNESLPNNYDILTPAIFSGGASLHFLGATVTAGISYQDFSQMEFGAVDGEEEGAYFRDLNRDILRQLKGRTTYGIGAEYRLPVLPLTVRGSYEYFVSPFYEDGPEASGSTYAFGGSLVIGDQTSIDGTFRYRDFNNVSIFPGGGNFINNIEQPLTIALGVTYRY